MANWGKHGIDRRRLLIGGGAGVGLVVGYALWPRAYPANLTRRPGEQVFDGWLKIGGDGMVTVAVPQLEHGQGAWTALAQIAADELGADWRTVAVEPAPLNPRYANPVGLRALFEGAYARAFDDPRVALMATVGSSSVRQFEAPLRNAGAVARVLLCKAAAARWDADWRQCRTAAGFVEWNGQRLRFGELAEAAADEDAPDPVPVRGTEPGRLAGKSLPRLDAPAKVDGSANFTGDVRLPGMVFAAIRQGPLGDSKLVRVDRAAADRVRGVSKVVTADRWVAAVGETWWAANKGLAALSPRFETAGGVISDATISAALAAAFDGDGYRLAAQGDLSAVFAGAGVVTATYESGLGHHAALEPTTATARYADGRLELWLPTQAPGAARAAAAAALGIGADDVTLHAPMAGGAFGERLDPLVAAQAAVLARDVGKPVQLSWSRLEDIRRVPMRPAAMARMSARLGANGQILGWLAKVAAPATGAELAGRLFGDDWRAGLATRFAGDGDAYAAGGMALPYAVPNFAIDHHPAEIGVATGHWRSGAHFHNVFFRECFLDELAHVAGAEAMSYRIGMLGGEPRLARCLSTAASLGGWEGGVAGSGQGIACHAFRDSRIAVFAEAHFGDGGRPVVDRLVAAVDCGRMVNPDLVRQQVEGGLVFGLAATLAPPLAITENLVDATRLGELGLPRLADMPDITVELIPSEAAPGGVAELAVPVVGPAVANALRAATGQRLRRLPLGAGEP